MDSKLYGAGNMAKTTVLLAGIGGLLVGIGFLLGGMGGAVIGLVFGVGISGFSYWKSDKLAVKAAGAVPVAEAEAPNLYAAVREISRRADIPMPRVYFIESAQPNAFATGRNPEHAVVAVTRGLVDLCDRDELMGVIAHEVGHIRHRDILIGSVAAAIATAITFVANMAMWAGMFGGGGSDDDGPSPVAVIAIALTAPIAAGLLQMALSRSREFEADRAGAELMGDPEPLAQALLKLDSVAARVPADVNPAQASAYIVNPLRGRKSATRWFMTHPPVEERVERLRALRIEPVR
ncbi:MAG TPA: M48 family metalloprotease [Acidimicrobiales bacterium]